MGIYVAANGKMSVSSTPGFSGPGAGLATGASSTPTASTTPTVTPAASGGGGGASTPVPAATPSTDKTVYSSSGQVISPSDPNYAEYQKQNNPAPASAATPVASTPVPVATPAKTTTPAASAPTVPAPSASPKPITEAAPITAPVNVDRRTDAGIYADDLQRAQDIATTQQKEAMNKIEQYYQSLITGASEAGEAEKSASNAMALAAGLAGSGTAQAGISGVEEKTTSAVGKIKGQLASDIAKVYQTIATNAATIGENMANLDIAQRNKVKTDAVASLDTLAQSGKSAADIKAADPQFYQNLLDQTGMTEYQMASYIDDNKNNPNKPAVKEYYTSSEDGTSTVLHRITLTKDGKSTEQQYTINAPLSSIDQNALIKGGDGSLWMQTGDGTAVEVTPGASTTNQKDYQFYVKQEKSAGRTPLTFDDWTSQSKAPAAVKEYNAAVKAGFSGTMIEYQQQKKGAGSTLDADTVNYLAQQYMVDGKIPSFGMGIAGMTARTQFYKAVADLAASQGKSGQQVAASQMAAKSAAAALTNQTKLNAATKQAEAAAIKNADYAVSLADKMGKYQMPDVNKFTNWINGKLGNQQLTAFEVALFTATREYAKVASGSAGSVAGLTESAQREAADLLNSAMNMDQLKAAVNTMKVDMSNVEESQSATEAGLRQDIIDYGGGTTATDSGSGGGVSADTTGKSGDNSFDSIWD